MAKKSHPIRTLLHPSRVIIPIVLGLGVAAFLLYINLTDVRFERVPDGTGTYAWQDMNNNGYPDLNKEEEFTPAEKGNYTMITYEEILLSVQWSWNSTFWILMAIAMMVTRDLAYMYRIRVLSGYELKWRSAFDVIMLWEFASAVTPSVIGGSPIAIFFVNKEGINVGRSTTIVLITSLLDEIFFITMVPLVYLFMQHNNMFPLIEGGFSFFNLHTGVKFVFISSYSLILFYCCIVTYGILISPQGFKKIIVTIFKLPFLKKWTGFAEKTGDEIIFASKELKSEPWGFWAKSVIATYFSWTARYMVVNCIILAFAAGGDQFLIYARQLAMWIIMLISPTPGSSGIAEYAFTAYLGEFIPEGLNSTLALLWRLLSYYPYLFVGAIILPAWIKRVYIKRKLISFKRKPK